jgi:hypothetical protein
VDLSWVDLSPRTGKVTTLDLGPDQTDLFSGDVSDRFVEVEPFKFLGL